MQVSSKLCSRNVRRVIRQAPHRSNPLPRLQAAIFEEDALSSRRISKKSPSNGIEFARRSVSRVLSPAATPAHRRRGWPFIWDARYRTPRATNPGDGAESRLPSENGASPLFGLAPGGVYRAAPVAGGAVRSYRTLSPLPAGLWSAQAVCFLWHFPWGRPRRALPGTASPWSPDFPPPGRSRKAAIRPSGTSRASDPGVRIQRANAAATPSMRASVEPSSPPVTRVGRKCR